MNRSSPVLVPIDLADLSSAAKLVRALAGHVGGIKLGLEFVTHEGPQGVRAMAAEGLPIFLDLKFHDIPNTVAGAVRAAAALEVAMLTVHAAGGCAMIEAAASAAAKASRPPWILAVTVLTSLDARDLADLGVTAALEDQVVRLGRLAVDAGADGLVCSPHEIGILRAALGPGPRLVVPGIRPQGSAADDQKRTATPRHALEQGADRLVIGRPITAAADPAAAARRIARDLGL